LAGIGAPVAALLIVVMAFASGGDGESAGLPKAIAVTVAAGTPAGSNDGGAANQAQATGSATQVSQELVSYIAGIQPILYSYLLSLDSVAKLTGAPSMGSSSWKEQVSSAAQTIKDNDSKLRDLKPPSCVANAQATLIKAAETLDKGADSLASGVRSSNSSTISAAAAQIASVAPQVNQATIEITRARC